MKQEIHKWKAITPVHAYILAKSGKSNKEIWIALGVSETHFNLWTRKHPEFKEALSLARSGKNKSTESIAEYVYKQLSPDMQRIWDGIMLWEDAPSGVERIEAMLSGQSRKTRQSLWVHAMLHYSFNSSEACRVINIPYSTLKAWMRDDPEFIALVDEVQHHKKNFFETGLVKLAEEGNTLAIMMANKTLNADRGYSEKLKVEHSGTVNHFHIPIPLDRLDLPVEVLLQIEEAMKRLPAPQEKRAIPA